MPRNMCTCAPEGLQAFGKVGGTRLSCALPANPCIRLNAVLLDFLASLTVALPGSRSGKCGNVCPTDPNAIVSCLNGRCSFACTGSYTQCINANGQQFCADLQQDNNNCGALPTSAPWAGTAGHACPAPLHDGSGSVACAGRFCREVRGNCAAVAPAACSACHESILQICGHTMQAPCIS